VGLIVDTVVACDGVTAMCDHTNSAATTTAIVHVERIILCIVAPFAFVNRRSHRDPAALQDDAVAAQK